MKKTDLNIKFPEGIKKTKPRQRILGELISADNPMSAADLYERIMLSGDSIPLSTIYRTLDLFAKSGLLAKLSVPDAGISLYELNRHEHRHYAVCVSCRKTIDLEYCPLKEAALSIQDAGFHVLGHRLELYGYCAYCYEKNKIK